jgi:chemotaxis protein CheZ
VTQPALNNQDSEALESLFDSIAAQAQEKAPPANVQPAAPPLRVQPAKGAPPDPALPRSEQLISRVGQITRSLHDSLRELGYNKLIEEAVSAMPDARDRLSYIASMTEQAATRALNAIEVAKPIQSRVAQDAGELKSEWDKLDGRALGVGELIALVGRTRKFLGELPQDVADTDAQLTEIMMAQDFQDLTGQVIKKITDIVQRIERDMVQLLLDYAPAASRRETSGMLNGPVISAAPGAEVVTNQNQVDDLLESLGF